MRNFPKLANAILLVAVSAIFFVNPVCAANNAVSSNAGNSTAAQDQRQADQVAKTLGQKAHPTVSIHDGDADESDLVKISPTVRRDVYRTAVNYMNGMTVTTSPILGLKSAWNASDLLYQIPSMNEDLLLLQDRDTFNRVLESLGSSLDMRPLLVFSGGVEGTVGYNSDYTSSNSMDINLGNAEVDLWAVISQWASAFVTINFDGSPPQTGARVANSRLFLQRGFVTIGNLEQTPFYATIGQLFVPFGRYSSAMVTTPLTKSLGRIEARALILGYFRDGFYAEIYGDNGDAENNNSDNIIFQGGGNIGYKNIHSAIGSIDIGAGYTTNIADSQGMQENGLSSGGVPATQFAGFGGTVNASNVSANNIAHSVGAVDVHAALSRGITTIIAEYITATERFDQGDLSFNGEGALVRALQTELDFNFIVSNKPVTVGAAYNRSWDALPLNLPQQSYFLVASTSFWKNTVESLEYRHDTNYAITANTGGGGSGDISLLLPVTSANVGGSQDMITFQIGAYF